jgi:predicted alpha/beta-hydrolase family hydrolase
MTATHFLFDGDADSPVTFAFAHGAGGAMDTPFMKTVAAGLGKQGIRVARFEFPYMAARRESGKRGAPDRQPVLLDTWRRVVAELGGRVAIGGKSMGGRMASMVADELQVPALVCLGYPFHPPGKAERVRTAHLATLQTPTLIVQGTRDMFGTENEVAGYELSPSITIEWLPDGDHSFKPRKSSGVSESENVRRAVDVVAAFLLRA